MPMTTIGLKNAIVSSIGAAGVTVEDEAALEALAKAIVEYIQLNASVSEVIVDPGTHIQVPGSGVIS